MAKGQKNLNLSPEAAELIEEQAEKYGTSQKNFVQRLVFWTKDISDDQVNLILSGKLNTVFEKLSESIHNLAWADHAFRTAQSVPLPMFASWSIQEYQRLTRTAKNERGIINFALYRLAFSWAHLARTLRASALLLIKPTGEVEDIDKWHELYAESDECLRRAIAYNTKPKDLSLHPVWHFNIACEKSMRALYLWERWLASPPAQELEWARNHLNSIRSAPDDAELVRALFSHFGEVKDDVLKSTITKWLLGSITSLGVAVSSGYGGWIDMTFIVGFAHYDDDLSALRSFDLTRSQLEELETNNPQPSAVSLSKMLGERTDEDIAAALELIPQSPAINWI